MFPDLRLKTSLDSLALFEAWNKTFSLFPLSQFVPMERRSPMASHDIAGAYLIAVILEKQTFLDLGRVRNDWEFSFFVSVAKLQERLWVIVYHCTTKCTIDSLTSHVLLVQIILGIFPGFYSFYLEVPVYSCPEVGVAYSRLFLLMIAAVEDSNVNLLSLFIS